MRTISVYRVRLEPTSETWVLVKDGSGSAVGRYGTKVMALVSGQRVARSDEPSRLVVHHLDGGVELEWNYGRQAYQPTEDTATL